MLYQKFGSLRLDGTATDVTDSLTALDPARAVMMALFRDAVNAELGPRWTKVTNTLPATALLRGTLPVQDTLELEPDEHVMQQRKARFPLMALYRHGEAQYAEHTLSLDKLTQRWRLDYILGPVDTAERRRVQDIMISVAKVIARVVRERSHPSHQSGRLVFGEGDGDLARVAIVSHEGPGQAVFAGSATQTLYTAMTLTLETIELATSLPGAYAPLEGLDADIEVGEELTGLPGLVISV